VRVIDFAIRGKEKAQLAVSFLNRLQSILDAEGIEYDLKVIAELINKHFPDWRRVLNECQRYHVGAKLTRHSCIFLRHLCKRTGQES
jgi:hypothetical protein